MNHMCKAEITHLATLWHKQVELVPYKEEGNLPKWGHPGLKGELTNAWFSFDGGITFEIDHKPVNIYGPYRTSETPSVFLAYSLEHLDLLIASDTEDVWKISAI